MFLIIIINLLINYEIHWKWILFWNFIWGYFIFKNKKFRDWKFIGILFLSLIFLIINLKITNQFGAANINNEQKVFYKTKVLKIFPKQYLIENDFREKFLLNRGYFLKGKKETLNLNVNDNIQFCGIEKKQFNEQKNHWLNKENSLNLIFIDSKKCSIIVKKHWDLRNLIKEWLMKNKNDQLKNWLSLFIFQEITPDFRFNWEKIQTLSIQHLFIISGFHLWIFYSIFKFFFKKRERSNDKWSIFKIFLWFFLFFITYLTNWKLSTTKSFLLISWYLFGNRNQKENRLEKLALIAIGFLLWNPFLILRIDFQLTFLASFILYWKKRYFQKKHWFLNFLQSNFLIVSFLLPILINLNYQMSLWILILNLVFSIFFFGFYPIFYLLILFPWTETILIFILKNIELILDWFFQNNHFIVFGKWSDWSIFLYYSFWILIFLNLINLKKVKNNCFLLISIMGLTFSNWYQPFYQFHMINVYHGLAMVLQSPNKKINILFDAGSGNQKINNTNKIKKYLWKSGIKKIDAVFISHNHTDHFNNIEYLKKFFEIKKVYKNSQSQKEYWINNILFQNLNYPFSKYASRENNKSLALQFKIKKVNFLLTFDLEKANEIKLLTNHLLTKTDIWQVSHHGLKSSNDKDFIKYIQPKFCLISNNKIILEVEEILKKNNCEIFHTHKNKDISFKI